MIRRPPRSTLDRSSAASDVYKRQHFTSNFIYTCRFTILQLSHSTHFLFFANNLIPKIPIPSCTIKPTHSHYHLFITANIIQIFEVFFPHSPHIYFISYKSTIPIHYSEQVPLILIFHLSRFLQEELPIPLYVPIHPPSKLFIYLFFSLTYASFSISFFLLI